MFDMVTPSGIGSVAAGPSPTSNDSPRFRLFRPTTVVPQTAATRRTGAVARAVAMVEEYDAPGPLGFLKIIGLARLTQLQHEGAVPEIARREFRAYATQKVDELRASESSFDLELAESKDLHTAIERFFDP